MGRLDLPDPVRDEDVWVPEPCTCTLACIPQGMVGEQVCRQQLDGPDEHDCVTAAHLRDCGFCRAVVIQIAAGVAESLDAELREANGLFSGR